MGHGAARAVAQPGTEAGSPGHAARCCTGRLGEQRESQSHVSKDARCHVGTQPRLPAGDGSAERLESVRSAPAALLTAGTPPPNAAPKRGGRISYSWQMKWPPQAPWNKACLVIIPGLSSPPWQAGSGAGGFVVEQQVAVAGRVRGLSSAGVLCANGALRAGSRLRKVTPRRGAIPEPLLPGAKESAKLNLFSDYS